MAKNLKNKEDLAFQKKNYLIMLAGIGVLVFGFILMTLDQEPYGFGFLGITLGPIVVLTGFLIQFFAIFYKDKAKKENE